MSIIARSFLSYTQYTKRPSNFIHVHSAFIGKYICTYAVTERKIIICYFVSAIIALLQNHRWQRTCIHDQSCNPSGHQVQLLDHPDKNY